MNTVRQTIGKKQPGTLESLLDQWNAGEYMSVTNAMILSQKLQERHAKRQKSNKRLRAKNGRFKRSK